MELTELKDKIVSSFVGDRDDLERILGSVDADQAFFPFNEYEYLICNLLEKGGLTYAQYIDIRTEYLSENPNLWLFEMSSPRGFGEGFAQTFVQGKCSKLKKPSKKLDPDYNGAYDLWLDNIKIEVKASRAVDSSSDEPLYMKALSRNTEKPFLMNFQQLKPQYCDVFIWLAIFRDKIVLWIMSSDEVLAHPLYPRGQHRGNKGNEGQLHIKHDNIHLLGQYELQNDDIEDAVIEANRRQKAVYSDKLI